MKREHDFVGRPHIACRYPRDRPLKATGHIARALNATDAIEVGAGAICAGCTPLQILPCFTIWAEEPSNRAGGALRRPCARGCPCRTPLALLGVSVVELVVAADVLETPQGLVLAAGVLVLPIGRRVLTWCIVPPIKDINSHHSPVPTLNIPDLATSILREVAGDTPAVLALQKEGTLRTWIVIPQRTST